MPATDPLAPYDYLFPKSAIATAPASPRDSAKLLVYRRANGGVTHITFRNLADFLPANAVVVFNETKVILARLTLTKPTGGNVRVLYLDETKIKSDGAIIRVLADRPLKKDLVLTLTPRLKFTVVDHREKYYFLRPNFPIKNLPAIFQRYGAAPIPPYIRETPLSPQQLKAQYQTVFARQSGSVAAPTASLHFTKRLMGDLKKKGITLVFATLHVGLGTFAPLTNEHLTSGTLHHEQYEISKAAAKVINNAKKKGRPIIAVGTTVARMLESATGATGGAASRTLTNLFGSTDLFIREGYKFKIVDGLITNFHVPKSSLLMMVAALAGRKEVLDLYKEALANDYKLFSFGDGMLIL